eukprot:scpid88591/ scgid10683/ Mannose-binding protein C; MBP1; Mannan-binding protein; Mannose-binding lectin
MIRLTLACVLCLVCMTLAAEITSKKSKRHAEEFLDSLEEDETNLARRLAEARRAAGSATAKKVNHTAMAMGRREAVLTSPVAECCKGQENGLVIYLYVKRPLNRQAARLNCQRFKGDLAGPRNMQEFIAMENFLRPVATGGCFLQYNDIKTEGKFVDSRDKYAVINNFEVGEPNNVGPTGEDCVEITPSTGMFNDVGCQEERQSVCEFRIE